MHTSHMLNNSNDVTKDFKAKQSDGREESQSFFRNLSSCVVLYFLARQVFAFDILIYTGAACEYKSSAEQCLA